MPIPVLCPACEAKIIAPDSSLGKRMKCPGCGDRLTVVSVNDAIRRASRHDDRNHAPVETTPLDPGWKRVALGYRLYPFALLALPLAVVFASATWVVALVMALTDQKLPDDALLNTAFGLASVFFGFVGFVLMVLGNLFFMGMPPDEKGGRGRLLAMVMFILGLVPGLNALPLILLPVYSAGVGQALRQPQLTRYGWRIVTWYVNGALLVPALVAMGVYSSARFGPSIYTLIAGGAAAILLEGGVMFNLWKTLSAIRHGIEEAIRERGLNDTARG